MSGSLSVNLKEWELEAKLHDDKTTHFSGTPSEQVWKRDHALGRGGFGEVWKETWDETNGSNRSEKRPRVRAVKRIRKTDKATQELPNLIKLSTKRYYGRDHLQHFVEFFGWFQDQHNIYVSMEYIPNHDLQQHIQERHGNANGFDESEGAFIVMEITKALKFMHEKNVMHRDLKPANILIYKPAPHWKIKLADFGISKDIELAGAHTKAGTDGYMAPEVADTNRKIPYTSAVDIWSLGAVTFCIQTGKPPFQDTLAVGRYIDGKGTFPLDHLLRFTGKLVVFIMQLMDIVPTRRPSVDQVLQHAWVNTMGDVPQDQEGDISGHGEWSESASAEWPPSRDSSIEEPENFNQSSSPPNPNRLAADISHLPLSPIKRPISPLVKIHHVASNPVGMRTAGYSGALPPRPSSSPAEDVEHDLASDITGDSKLNTYVESFQHHHEVNHKSHLPPAQPLAQPLYLYPSKRTPERSLWQSRHGDSGYYTESSSSAPSRPRNEEIRTGIEARPMLAESPQLHASDPLLNNYAEEQNHVPIEFIGPLKLNQVRVTEECRLKPSPGARPSPNENNLIDFDDPNPGPVGNTPHAPQYGPLPLQESISKAPLYGPWLPFENPWT